MAARDTLPGQPDQPQGGSLLTPLPIALLDDPLDYLVADHARQRLVCAALRRFAEAGSTTRLEAAAVVALLRRDLPLHQADEDQDLFPAIRRRAEPEDALGAVLGGLAVDHRRAETVAEHIVEVLSVQPQHETIRLDAPAQALLLSFAAAKLIHLAMESSVVLAIGRFRLTRKDLRLISRGMKARRGISS